METEDLTGQKFGMLTVMERVEDYVTPKGIHFPQWLCKCECGNEKVIVGYSLKSGATRSCGCLRKEKVEALIGQKFGMLTVMERVEDYVSPKGQHHVQYLCKCECGNEKIVSAPCLKYGRTKSCGCIQGKNIEAMVGQRFDMLTVIKRVEDHISPKGKHVSQLLCKCDCGNEKIVTINYLKSGTVKSCGCLNKAEDLTGQRFGKLVVLERAEDYVSPKGIHMIQWLCKCDCGKEKVFTTSSLKSGEVKSCGCKHYNRLIDLTGQRFGRLTVMERAEDYVSPKGRHIPRWLCKCDCGKEKVINSESLKSGKTKSCGCLYKSVDHSSLVHDLTGQRFGNLVVVKRADDCITPKGLRKVQWLCKCDCGNEKVVAAAALKSGAVKSCGYRYDGKFINIIGQRFGMLTVVERAEDYVSSNDVHRMQWLCKCDCGNETIVQISDLKSGRAKSCGCLHSNIADKYFEDLTGHRFGKLTVVEHAEDYVNVDGKHSVQWLCKCDCGNEKIIIEGRLKYGNIKSCGCEVKIFEDLTNQRFGDLVAVERVEDYVSPRKVHEEQWLCKCDCGNEKVVRSQLLKSGKINSCGCSHKK